jgi:LuxR family maltose regulon positive regulatory protein
MVGSYPLINTKVRTPRRRQAHLRRQRLVNYIHNSIQNKLILVSAAAGYGKTSLLVDYAHDAELPICWYSLDPHDAHVLTFVEYLVASIRQRFPEFGASVLELARHFQGPLEDVEPFVRQLIDEMERCISQYFVLVLDDYHEVSESEPVNALVDGLLRYLPEQCHMIIASRGIPHRLTLTRLAARQEVVGLGVEHLRFTAEEIYALLHDLSNMDLTPEQACTLAERSEGWITGILLAAQTGWTGATQGILQISGASGGVFDYMAEEVLGRQPPHMQRFLLGSALFQEMTPPLCDALLGISNAAELLRQLSTQNLFTFALDAEGVWYQYHQLFRQFLLAKYARDDPQGYRQLCLKQAEIMTHRGHLGQAIDSYLQAQAFQQAADALEALCQDTFDAGNWEGLRQWIDALPEAELERRPRLLLFRAKIFSETGNLARAADLLERSYQAYMQREDILGAARALVQIAVVQRFRVRLREAIASCQQVLQMVGDRDVLTLTLARHNIGICRVMLGQTEEGITELLEALRLAEENADEINAAYTAHDLGTAELMRGRLPSARQYYHRALMYWRKIGNEAALAATLESLGVVHHHLGQYAEAENRLQEGLAKARRVRDARVEAYAVASLGDLYKDTARYDEALTTYRTAMELASAGQLARLIIYLLDAMGNVYRIQGDNSHARQMLTEAMDLIQGDDMPYEEGLCQLSRAILSLQQSETSPAAAGLRRAEELFSKSGSKRDLGRTHLYLTALGMLRQDEAQMLAHLQKVAELAQELGSQQFIVAEGATILPVVQAAIKLGASGLDYTRVRAEIEQLAPAAVKSPPGEAQPSPPLEFLGLNGGQVLKMGQLVTDWESTAARVMAFLFASHPRGLARDKVIAMLWPDVSQAKGNSLFHSSMYRLRSALSKSLIVHENGVYRINPAQPWRFDVDDFRRLAKAGRGDDENAQQARLQAIDLYHGPFLESFEDEWCQEMRASLERDMLDLLLTEAGHEVQRGFLEQAENLYLRALAIDSYDERATRGIMWCRIGSNDHGGALRQYRECARLLREELDVDPSAETLQLYEAIISGRPITPLH